MRNRVVLPGLMLCLTSCSMMPGMQNPEVSRMAKVTSAKQNIQPVLIPITPDLVSRQKTDQYNYRIAPADVLNVIIWQHPEFTPKELAVNQISGQPSAQGGAGREGYLVNAEGYIYLPLVGKVYVAGKTTDQVRVTITNRLKEYLKNPELNVRVVDFRGQKVYMIGEIKNPGFVPITDQPLSITDAISLRGGIDSNTADPAHIYVIRGNLRKPDVYWLNARTPEGFLLAEHFILHPGDVLYISSASAARWNRVLNQLLPTIQTIWYTQAIIQNA